MHRHLPERWDVEEAWYFVTVVTRDRRPYFSRKDNCSILLQACHFVREKRPYRLGALMIMPDHWHGLIKPKGVAIETIIGNVKQRVFQVARQTRQNIMWQTRFMDHRIRDEADYFQHLEYMRLNPYKHQLVDNEAAAWPWWFVHADPFGEKCG